jgi:phosphoribosylaminoimidazole (AIR) synthetase
VNGEAEAHEDATGTTTAPSLSYASTGVDIDAANDSKHRIKAHVESTLTSGARGAFGGFGGLFRMPSEAKRPLLVSSADGVGTKIKVAIEADRHDTVGHCLVNHCTNDILVQGAVPLFFLDYVAFGKLVPATVEGIVAGVAAGCRENGASLVADVLLRIHRSYLNVMRPVLGHVHAMAHITGGGLTGNLDRALPPDLDAVVDLSSWNVPNTFRVLQEAGGVARDEMFRAFNMGVGMVVTTDATGASKVQASAAAHGVDAWILGAVVPGSGAVVLK